MSPIDGSAKPRNLTAANKGTDIGPVFSPDGKTLAYRSMARAGYEADKLRVMVQAWPQGPARDVTGAWDRSPNELIWSTNGKVLYATAQDVGQQSLFAIDVATGTAKALLAKGTVTAPARVKAAAADAIAVLVDDLRSPAEVQVVSADASAGAPVVRTSFNKDRVAATAMGDAEQFSFPGWNNETVHGYVVKPAGFEAGKKYPVAFLIHGGPQGSFGNHFHYRWNPQTYAGAGYAAVMIDFHGSTGYGQGFTDAIRGDWGGKPLVDLQKGLDAAIAKYAWLDGDEGLRARRVLRRLHDQLDRRQLAGPLQVPRHPRRQPRRADGLLRHRGAVVPGVGARAARRGRTRPATPSTTRSTTSPSGRRRCSSSTAAATIASSTRRAWRRSPRCSAAASRASSCYFPDENHWVLKPANSILWHETVLGWLDRWLKQPGGGTGSAQ